ncbi:MAG: amino acid permease [Gammaproteobacteria bacterium]|nr:amino acid permease [Gammaproteobacteria bacterium]
MAVMSTKIGRSLGIFDIVMINVIAVDSLRTLPFSAEYGFSLVFYYILASITFFIPVGLVSAELATGWPNKGGIYVWVREAFGDLPGFVVIWLQWVYNIVWYPTILSFIAATLAYLINPALAESKVYMLLVILVIFWGATFINFYGMRVSSLVSTLGALFGTLFPMFFIIALGVIWLLLGNPTQISFTTDQFIPTLVDPSHLSFLTAVLFGLVGVEMSAVHADEVKNPGKVYPKAILYSTIIIFTTLVLSSLAIALVVPKRELNVVTGLVQAFEIFFSAYNLNWMGPVITFLIIVGGIGSVATWIIGPTKGLLVAAQDGSVPPLFGLMNKRGVPVTLLIFQGTIFTILCAVFLLMPTVSSSYWVLTAMTAQLAMLVYIALFAAALWLRFKKPEVVRSYRIPMGNLGISVVCILGVLSSTFAIVLGFIPPAQLSVGNIVTYESILILGILLLTAPPIIIYLKRKPNWLQLST